MRKEVFHVKTHTCPTCGGQLIVNEDRQMYECLFCGVTFDYEYFNKDDVLELGARALSYGEFQSARQAYNFMLTKDPHNFQALRGEILIDAMLTNTSDLGNAEVLRKLPDGRYNMMEKRVDVAITEAMPEHTGYFNKMKELLAAGREYQNEQSTIKKIHGERKRGYSNISSLENEKEENYVAFRSRTIDEYDDVTYVHPRTLIILAAVIYLIWSVAVVAIISTKDYSADNTKTSSRYSGQIIRSKTSSSGWNEFLYGYNGSTKKVDPVEEQKEKDAKFVRGAVLIPLVPMAMFFAYMGYKWKKIQEVQHLIQGTEANITEMDHSLSDHTAEARRIKIKIHDIYRDLRSMDPYPEVQHLPGNKLNGKKIQ